MFCATGVYVVKIRVGEEAFESIGSKSIDVEGARKEVERLKTSALRDFEFSIWLRATTERVEEPEFPDELVIEDMRNDENNSQPPSSSKSAEAEVAKILSPKLAPKKSSAKKRAKKGPSSKVPMKRMKQ
jgi:hypothetical protein